MLGLSTGISQAAANLRSYVKEGLKLYLDFKTHKADTLKFPCEGSTSFDGNDYVSCGNDSSITGVVSNLSVCCWFKRSTNGSKRSNRIRR